MKELLESGKAVRHGSWNEKEIEILNKHLFLTSKPLVYLVNLTELDYIRKKNKWLPKIKTWIDENDAGGLAFIYRSDKKINRAFLQPSLFHSVVPSKTNLSTLTKLNVKSTWKRWELQKMASFSTLPFFRTMLPVLLIKSSKLVLKLFNLNIFLPLERMRLLNCVSAPLTNIPKFRSKLGQFKKVPKLLKRQVAFTPILKRASLWPKLWVRTSKIGLIFNFTVFQKSLT